MFLGIMQVDAKATRHSNRFDAWHMEVAGPFNNAFNNHIIDDVKKSFHIDLLNLIAILKNHLDCDINATTKINVFCTKTVSKYMIAHISIYIYTLSIEIRLTLYALNIMFSLRLD